MLPNRWNIFRTLLVHFILIHKSDSKFDILRFYSIASDTVRQNDKTFKERGVLQPYSHHHRPNRSFNPVKLQVKFLEPIRNRGQSGFL